MNKHPNQPNDGQSPDKSVPSCRRQSDRRSVPKVAKVERAADVAIPLYDQFLLHVLRVLGREAAETYLRRAWAKGRQEAHVFLVRNHPRWRFKRITPADLPENPLEFLNPNTPAMIAARRREDLNDLRRLVAKAMDSVLRPSPADSAGESAKRPPC